MSQQLSDARKRVVDEQSFIDFLGVLAADREDEVAKEKADPSSPYGPGKNGWENGTIEAFLWAAQAWAMSSINGLPLLAKSTNPWRRCADILYCGKIYE